MLVMYFSGLFNRIITYMVRELPVEQAGFRKGKGTRDQIANLRWVMEKNHMNTEKVAHISVQHSQKEKMDKC